MLLLQDCRLGNLLCQSVDQRNDMLSDDWPMDFGRVRQDDIAIDQLRKEKLVHCRTGSMHPSQISRDGKLLWPEGYCKDDLSIAQMLVDAFVRVVLDDFEF